MLERGAGTGLFQRVKKTSAGAGRARGVVGLLAGGLIDAYGYSVRSPVTPESDFHTK